MGILTKNEIITLKYFEDGKKGEAPEGLTQAQYYTALKSLKNKGMVFVQFVEGGEVYASQIKTEGLAALDDLKDEEDRKLRVILRNLDITQNQYKLLCHIKEIGHDENIFEVPWNTYKNEIWLPIYQNGYLKTMSGSDKKYLVLTDKGKELLQEIEDNLYGDGLGDLWQPVSSGKQLVPVAPVEQPKKMVRQHNITISADLLTDAIKVFHAMCKVGYFEDNGKPAKIKDVMDTFGDFFHADRFKTYSSYHNSACQAGKSKYFETFEILLKEAEKFYNETNTRKTNKR